MSEEDIIPRWQELLSIYRSNLYHLVRQAAQYGSEVNAPLPVFNGIQEARKQIRHAIDTLHSYGVIVQADPLDQAGTKHNDGLDVSVPTQRLSRNKTPKRLLVYELKLPDDPQRLQNELYSWHFYPPLPHQHLAIVDGALEIGLIDDSFLPLTLNRIVVPPLDDCSVECEICIMDDGGNPSQWAGIRIRAFTPSLDSGHLIHLRATGTVEWYRAREILDGTNRFIVKEPMNSWVHLRIDMVGERMRVWVNKKKHIDKSDRVFGNEGGIYIHTHGVIARYRNLRIYKVERP